MYCSLLPDWRQDCRARRTRRSPVTRHRGTPQARHTRLHLSAPPAGQPCPAALQDRPAVQSWLRIHCSVAPPGWATHTSLQLTCARCSSKWAAVPASSATSWSGKDRPARALSVRLTGVGVGGRQFRMCPPALHLAGTALQGTEVQRLMDRKQGGHNAGVVQACRLNAHTQPCHACFQGNQPRLLWCHVAQRARRLPRQPCVSCIWGYSPG
mgnify:CR=1 FL=1